MPDLFDIFKNQESKLHERPPDVVWKKLEARLDRKRRRKRRGLQFLQLSTVVLILLLMLLAAVVVWHYVKKAGG